MNGADVAAGVDRDVDPGLVGVCVVRAECVHGERRLTVTTSSDIREPPGLAQHPVDAAEAARLVREFLEQLCPPAAAAVTGTT